MFPSTTVIALDVGRSAVKVLARSGERLERIMFPSVVAPAIQITEENAARRAALETVEHQGRRFFFGQTAIVQGGAEVESGMSEQWIHDSAHVVLIQGAVAKLMQKQPPFALDRAILVVGLPAKFYGKQRSFLLDLMRAQFPDCEILVIPQPLGPYFAMQLGNDGIDRKAGGSKQSWGIVEVGHFTTDLALLRDGDWVERGSNSCVGASSAAKRLLELIEKRTGRSVTLLAAAKALEQRTITLFGETLDLSSEMEEVKAAFSAEVVPFAQRLWDRDASALHGIMVAGGGGELVVDGLNRAFGHVVLANDSRFAVAEGFLRAGLSAALGREAAARKLAEAQSTAG